MVKNKSLMDAYEQTDYTEYEEDAFNRLAARAYGYVAKTTKSDAINSPSHYIDGRSIEPIAAIEDWGLGYHLGNTLKYISRAGRKDDLLQDLKKAQWYLNKYIQLLEKNYEFK